MTHKQVFSNGQSSARNHGNSSPAQAPTIIIPILVIHCSVLSLSRKLVWTVRAPPVFNVYVSDCIAPNETTVVFFTLAVTTPHDHAAETFLIFAVSMSPIRVSFPDQFLRCCLAKNCPGKLWHLRTHSRFRVRVRTIHHVIVQILVDCLVTDSLDQFLAVVSNDQPFEHEVGFCAISQCSRLCALPRQLIQGISRCPCRFSAPI